MIRFVEDVAIPAALLVAAAGFYVFVAQDEPPPLMRSGLFPRVQTCREVLVLPECIDLAVPARCAPRRELRCE